MTERYAVYFVPHPETLLWRLGCLWHGRDPANDARLEPPLPDGLERERYEAIVSSARHYGFHATLKPPFELAAGTNAADLERNVAVLASRTRAFAAPALEVSRIGGFLAMTLRGRCEAMDRLGADCVADFDKYRGPAGAAELAARRKGGLTPRQDALLLRWGYPHVLEEWRFHMTLTASIGEPEITLVEHHLRALFRPVLAAPLFVDRIALFWQERREVPFNVKAWFKLGI